MPKFMLLVRATHDSESGIPPSTAIIEEMMAYNTSLSEAGILLGAEGFLSSSKGARVSFTPQNESSVAPGPFTIESIISGFWIIKSKSLDEAISWARKAPFRAEGSAIEVRQIAGPEDFFGNQLTDELKTHEEELRRRTEERAVGE
ncbi:uncharacterized protein N7473_005656 [Penicillium subrubescens]|uniref:YCII-related domain-containing protein n=1 Tax=Penicillium subrubescens TaxID=1316194 RepID=A0A1Q5T5N3_9EURO|nr:uncharacterized protein N7473_005656 [Penicillium subrubescens]KAJ5896257.1 hypothetical protein N7473_005656 [Penicillium subrubescens]OKO95547.1 hypothetical protein PENSUB_11059 [Penicillium subrubescens]